MDEERGKAGFDLHEQIKANEQSRRRLLAWNAQFLTEIFQERYFKEILGDSAATWKAYLSQIEVFYSRSTANSLLRIYKKLTLKLKIIPDQYTDLPLSRLIDILSIVTNENAEDWFFKARTLLSKDWKIEVRKAKGRITEEDEHEHKYEQYKICEICGQKHKETSGL